jgi:hypothetical protein
LTGIRRKKDQATGSGIGTIPPDPNSLPCQGESQEKKDGTALGRHAPTVMPGLQ